MKQSVFEVFVLNLLHSTINGHIMPEKIQYLNGKSNFKMCFNLTKARVEKEFFYNIFSDKMRFCELCRLQINSKANMNSEREVLVGNFQL